MPNPTDRDAIKITAEDLASVTIPASPLISPVAQSSGARVYGTINETGTKNLFSSIRKYKA